MKQKFLALLAVSGFSSFFLMIILYASRSGSSYLQAAYTPPEFYQTFPIERYPGIKCYVIATKKRHLVLTQNCDTVYVTPENITLGPYVIPRQTPNSVCNRCYFSDYLSIIGFVLFGRPDMGVKPLAPLGALIFEDDIVACNSSLPYLDQCFEQQFNCILGNGATMNFYAGATSKQPDPEHFGSKRFTSIDQLYDNTRIKSEPHVDWYIHSHKRHVVDTALINHLGAISTLKHNNPEQIRCPFEESLVGKKIVIERHKDITIFND